MELLILASTAQLSWQVYHPADEQPSVAGQSHVVIPEGTKLQLPTTLIRHEESTKDSVQWSLYYLEKQELAVMAIRGTADEHDLLRNAKFNCPVPLAVNSHISCHQGMGSAAAHIKQHVEEAYGRLPPPPNKAVPLYIAGHSLGGGVATCLALGLAVDGSPAIQAGLREGGLVTFGAPFVVQPAARSSQPQFERAINDAVASIGTTWSFVNRDDAVPRLLGGGATKQAVQFVSSLLAPSASASSHASPSGGLGTAASGVASSLWKKVSGAATQYAAVGTYYYRGRDGLCVRCAADEGTGINTHILPHLRLTLDTPKKLWSGKAAPLSDHSMKAYREWVCGTSALPRSNSQRGPREMETARDMADMAAIDAAAAAVRSAASFAYTFGAAIMRARSGGQDSSTVSSRGSASASREL